MLKMSVSQSASQMIHFIVLWGLVLRHVYMIFYISICNFYFRFRWIYFCSPPAAAIDRLLRGLKYFGFFFFFIVFVLFPFHLLVGWLVEAS